MQDYTYTKFQRTQQGFTLLELLVVMLLMGIMLALGVGSMVQQENSILTEAHKIVRVAMEARSRAILLNDNVLLEVNREFIKILHNDKTLYTMRLDGEVEIDAINGEIVDKTPHKIAIRHLGIIDESVIWLQQGTNQATIYLPAIGGPKIYDDYTPLKVIHEELL